VINERESTKFIKEYQDAQKIKSAYGVMELKLIPILENTAS
jgi:hypothetical protein